MAYKLWAGLAKTQAQYDSLKQGWMVRVQDSLHDALWKAMKINDLGQEIAWEIVGDDGVRLDRQSISEEIRKRRQELIANPPKTY